MNRFVALLPIMLLGSAQAQTDEEAQIVTTCYYANAEWGVDMVDLCVKQNRALRQEVLSLPDMHATAISRCRDSAELGWAWVKACVLKNQPKPAAASTPGNDRSASDACEETHGAEGIAAVLACVEQARKDNVPR